MSKRRVTRSNSTPSKKTKVDMDDLAVNTIRCLAADMPSAAKSGHPGAPMGCAPMAYLLWKQFMNYNPKNPKWFNRDRFVLSNGHACALQYAMLHLTGYDISLDDLKNFRQLGSKTPGHPEAHDTPGIEVTTGPLGQGIAQAVGLAMAGKHFAGIFNQEGYDLIDNYVYCILGDGCLQEGVASEACSLAGTQKLDNLIALYDDNKITIDGHTEISFTEDVPKRFQSYGWNTITVENGDTDLEAIAAAIEKAKGSNKPTLISVKTVIGYGSLKEGSHDVHGAPLKDDDMAQVKAKFGIPAEPFAIKPEVLEYFREQVEIGAQKEAEWNEMFARYKESFPELAAELERRVSGRLPDNWRSVLPKWTPEDKPLATRQPPAILLNALAPVLPELVGGSADLTGSNLTYMKCTHDFNAEHRDGRYFRFGVREFGMAAIVNGLFAYGGLIPFGATFFQFIQYCFNAVRLSALSHFGSIFIMTHDSIGLGEDGPTHQPINCMQMCRTLPNLLAIRPCDGNETSGAYAAAIENRSRPSVLVFTRQALPQLPNTSIEGVAKGGYVIHDDPNPQIVFVASGSEVSLCVDAAKELGAPCRVVSMPCTDLFDEQPLEYRKSVLLEGVPVMAVEMLCAWGWERYSHVQHGMTSFGASAPAPALFKHFGFTKDQIAAKARTTIDYYAANGGAPSLFHKPQF